MTYGQDYRNDQRGHGYDGQAAYGGTPAHGGQPGWGPVPLDGAPGMAAGQRPRRQGKKRHTARNALAGLVGLIVLIVIITVAASGGGHAVSTTGSGTGSGSAASGGSGSGGAVSGKPVPARIGSTITLSGFDSGEQMAVTVVRVISSGVPGDELTSAPAGDRLFAVQFRLRDPGSATYSDSPSNGAAVVDSSGQAYEASMTDTVTGCQAFPAVENVAPGSSGLGCIVFEVPSAAKITAVQFTLDSGMGPQTGQWTVKG